MRRRLGMLLLPLLGACATDEGILLRVSGDDLAELEFVVGVERDGRFLIDSETLGLRADVQGRRLRSRPYQLLLEPPIAHDGERILVLVRGRRADRDGEKHVVSVGVLDPPQAFVAGELLRRNIGLHGLGGQVDAEQQNGCYSARIGEQSWRWIAPANLDCDPVRADAEAPDCDDEDAQVYPGAPERCDGRDDSCDGQLGPERAVCFAVLDGEGGPCHEGTRPCELAGEGAGVCSVGEMPAPAAFCARWSSCAEFAEPRSCLLEASQQTKHCVQRLTSDGEICEGGKVALAPPRAADSCRWEIFETDGLTASFGGVVSTQACDPTLDLVSAKLPPSGTVTLDFFADGEPGWLVQVVLASETVESCEGVEAVGCD